MISTSRINCRSFGDTLDAEDGPRSNTWTRVSRVRRNADLRSMKCSGPQSGESSMCCWVVFPNVWRRSGWSPNSNPLGEKRVGRRGNLAQLCIRCARVLIGQTACAVQSTDNADRVEPQCRVLLLSGSDYTGCVQRGQEAIQLSRIQLVPESRQHVFPQPQARGRADARGRNGIPRRTPPPSR